MITNVDRSGRGLGPTDLDADGNRDSGLYEADPTLPRRKPVVKRARRL